MEAQELLENLEKYKKANPKWIKNNIYDLLKYRNEKKEYLEAHLGITPHTARCYINQANTSQVPFEMALKICILFSVELDDLIKENDRKLSEPYNKNKKWTKAMKEGFVKDYTKLSIKEIAEKYELKENSVIALYSKFINEDDEATNEP